MDIPISPHACGSPEESDESSLQREERLEEEEISNQRTWKRRVKKASLRGDAARVKQLLEEAPSSWHDRQLSGALKAAASAAVVGAFAEGAPLFFWDAGGAAQALLSAAKEGQQANLQWLLAKGVGPDALDPNANISPLQAACVNGNAACVRILLEHGADPSLQVEIFFPLHVAAINDSLECVETLLQFGADVSAEDHFTRQPLHWAADRGSPDIVKVLVAHGADPNAKDQESVTPLLQASHGYFQYWYFVPPKFKDKAPSTEDCNHLQCVKELIRLGADTSATSKESNALFLAIQHNAQSIFHYLKGVVNISYKTSKGNTALHLAATSGTKQMVKDLVDKGIDVNSQRNDGRTPLHQAIETADRSNAETAEELIRLGANVLLWDNEGMTALHIAANSLQLNVIRFVINAGGDVNLPNNEGYTPLHLASSVWKPEVMKTILEHGADLNVRTPDGRTPLHFAARCWVKDNVEELLNRGADISARDSRGWTALHHAADGGHRETLKYLVKNGLDIGARTDDGKTALHVAVAAFKDDSITTLLELRAPINARDDNGQTVLHGMAQSTDEQLVQELLKAGADPCARDSEGRTPIDLATSESVRRLIQSWALGA